VRFVALAELEIIPGVGLFQKDERIEILYRLYPLEYLANEVDEQGYPIGEALCQLVANGECIFINPSQSIVTQSKGMLAFIWTLHKQAKLFTEAEHQAIERWMLPTAWSAQPFQQLKIDYVSKSMFGREGKGTAIHKFGSEIEKLSMESTVAQYYEAQPRIYQQFQKMKNISAQTENGPFEGYLLTGVFIVGRKFAGLLPRIGGEVTGDLAYFCGAAVEKS
jgi:glutathionylspermidine synthase